MTTQTEVIRRICDIEEGVCFEIRPDSDGFGWLELITPDDKSKDYYGDIKIVLDKSTAAQIGQALIDASKEL